jgi:hypothetical protein
MNNPVLRAGLVDMGRNRAAPRYLLTTARHSGRGLRSGGASLRTRARRGNRFSAARRSPLSAHRSWRGAEPGFCIISARNKPDYHVGKDDDLTRFKAG